MMTKKCKKCGFTKALDDFKKIKQNRDGRSGGCKECYNLLARTTGAESKKKSCKAYEKTLKGKLVRTYRNMQSRVTGVQSNKSHLYEGLEILDRDSFYEWSLQDVEYKRLFKEWEDSGYELRLSPSIDRKNANKGYILSNMRWLTHSENSSITSR